MNVGLLCGIVVLAILVDITIGAHIQYYGAEKEVDLYTPSGMYQTTDLSKPACYIWFIVLHTLFLPLYVFIDIYTLSNLKRGH